MRTFILMAFAILAFSTNNYAQTEDLTTDTLEIEVMMEMYLAYVDSVTGTFERKTGSIEIGQGVARVEVPSGYEFLNGDDAETVLVDLWGNPPSDPASISWGMLLPEGMSISDSNIYVMNLTYSEEGYIDDSDAQKIDYDDLLKSMQDDATNANQERMEMGYPKVEIIGWASEPFYDLEGKKLHWAVEAEFDDEPNHTLNYNTRILGRKGFINMNAIGGMESLDRIQSDIDNLLGSVHFNSGSRYTDFNPDIDKVAGYGIAGLIAGKVLFKAGILAKIGLLLAKFWKFILVGFVAFGALVRRFFGGKSNEYTPVATQEKVSNEGTEDAAVEEE